ncbi:MAG: hypothetical protein QGG40_03505 [Myxococcota bacterium]|jgi:hypothetical protein|nr:hypothetical protein [Myxococcota bacterium]
MSEAVGLAEEAEGFVEETGLDFSPIVVLFQDSSGGVPDGEDAAQYHEAISEPDFPVMADVDQAVLDATPYTGQSLPGKCSLSPDMELLACSSGHSNETILDAIREHAGL